jgi:hypothetical protein
MDFVKRSALIILSLSVCAAAGNDLSSNVLPSDLFSNVRVFVGKSATLPFSCTTTRGEKNVSPICIVGIFG